MPPSYRIKGGRKSSSVREAPLTPLADKGYTGAGIGVLAPVKGTNLRPDDQT
ncbi:hypothetical protein [Actinomyces gaoshouyii]|uniref:Uncharacterized protein n=1 Tax=Actinomyces gaoshouyii TaxID=1960083 RepID=A0A8H9LLP9_9ACTO|nr:hypothetical protein [Actinomyces gaoshouyii]GGO98490.1 hypothetical protein GCM10011612_13510 [Actinomyces gaoshouyii]